MRTRPPAAIAVSGLGKRYRLQHQGQTTLKTAALRLFSRRSRPDEEFWALRAVSFEVRQGETLGIIGRNGAGKSTLLGLIAGTITPTEGTVRTNGRISSLLELGAGFHPDLTGRENIFLNGSILGLRRRDIAQRLDSIVAFSELERFIDHPVKHYSSGMFVRLAFSVAMEVDPDILILDEVLSVGDERFREKCRVRIGEFRRRGKTFLIVSHDMDTIQTICDRVLVLDRGADRARGRADPRRQRVPRHQRPRREAERGPEMREWGTREAVILGVSLRDARGDRLTTLGAREGFTAEVRWRASRRIEDPVFGFALCDGEGRLLYGTNTAIDGCTIPAIEGDGAIEFEVESIPFQRGRYYLTFAIHSRDHKTFHRLDNCSRRHRDARRRARRHGAARGAVDNSRVGRLVTDRNPRRARARLRACGLAIIAAVSGPGSRLGPRHDLRERNLRPGQRHPGRAARLCLLVHQRRERRAAHLRGRTDLRLHHRPALGAAAARGGARGVRVVFDSGNFAGEVVKEVEVRSNDPARPSVTLRVKALVEPEIDFEPRVVTFDDVRAGAVLKQVAILTNRRADPVRVLGWRRSPRPTAACSPPGATGRSPWCSSRGTGWRSTWFSPLRERSRWRSPASASWRSRDRASGSFSLKLLALPSR